VRLILIFVAAVLSYFSAPFVGNFYAQYVPHYGSFVLDLGDSIYISGFAISFVFFATLLLSAKSFKQNLNIILWIFIPLLLWINSAVNWRFFYFPCGLFLLALAIGYLTNKFQHKI
jgi:hypothetical protein